MASIPLSWNDPMFNGVTNINGASVAEGGTLSNKSISGMSSGDASVGGMGSFNLDTVRIDSREGVRVGGGGDITINNSYIETTGLAGDHADGIQAYAPGENGNITITNSAIVSHNNANATAGVWIADNYGGSLTLNNVMFEGGPYGLRVAADQQDITVALKDVYFVGPFGGGPLLFQAVNAPIHITQWENVRYASIVNGQLVPGDLIPPPFPVEGGGPSTPPSSPLDAPVIASYSNDTGKAGDGITSDNTLQLKGSAAANSTIKIYDGANQIGTTTANASGGWEYITSVLTNAQHVLKATATNASGQTSASSATLAVTVDNIAPTAPLLKSDTIVDTNKVLLSGTAEAGSTIKVYDGANVVGTGTTAANGGWSITTSALSTGSHNLTATATDAAGNVSAASQPADPVIGGPTTPPTQPSATPKIVSFSNDSGKAGDNITNDNTLTLKGTAQANTTVKVFDGSTQVGTVKADGSGNWSLTTSALKDGAHSFTATGSTNTAASVTATSAALAVTIDTKGPIAPVLKANSVVDTNHVLLSGTAEAGSAIKVYDGSTVVGTGMAGANGSWSITTGGLSNGTHTLTATATDVAGNASAASQSAKPVIGGGSTTPPTTPPSGLTGLVQVDNHYFLGSNGPELKYGGAAVTAGQFLDWTPISSVKIDGGGYNVAWKNPSGQFTFWATDSQGNFKSYPTHGVALAGNSTTVESYETIFHQDLNGDHTIGIPGATPPSTPSGLTGLVQVGNNYFLGGNGPELKYGGAAVTAGQFDDWIPISSVKLDGGGYDVAWKDSSGQFTFWTTDSQGNFKSYPTHGVALAANSTTVQSYETIFHQDLNGDHTIGVPGATATPTTPTSTTPASAVNFSSLTQSSSNVVTIQGTADAFSQVKMYDGKAYIGTTTAGADGTWSFASSSAVSNTVHTFNAVGVNSAGHTTAGSGSAILGSTGSNTMKSTSGNDIFIGKGNPDTFVFAANFGKDTIKDFAASGPSHDTIQFSESAFSDFASVLNHASQVGQDVVISTGDDSLTLKNTKLGALQSHDFHFA